MGDIRHILKCVLWASLLIGSALATSYQDCGSQSEVLGVEVTDCDIPPCIVQRGLDYSIEIDFVAGKDASDLQTKIIASVSGSDIDWPAPDACDLLGDKHCPIQQGETYNFNMTMPVQDNYPKIDVVVTVKLVDEDLLEFVCIQFPLDVV